MRPWPELLLALSILASTVSAQASLKSAPQRYLALGDSYTIGEGVAEHERWPEQWARALHAHGIEVAPPRIIAHTGWTTDELSAAMDAAEPLGHWDRVSLLIGVNNQYRGRDLDNYRKEFAALLDRAIVLAGGHAKHVWVLSIPDWGETPFARASGRDRAQIAREIDAYNAVNHEIAKARGAHWVDITDLSRRHGGNSSMLVDDGLHPSGAMYSLWVERIMAR
jgi:lysophospholipase L1-like esterase